MWLDVSWKFTCSGADSFERPGGSHSEGLRWLHRKNQEHRSERWYRLGSPGWTLSWGDHGSGPCQFGYGHPSEVPWDAATAVFNTAPVLPWSGAKSVQVRCRNDWWAHPDGQSAQGAAGLSAVVGVKGAGWPNMPNAARWIIHQDSLGI